MKRKLFILLAVFFLAGCSLEEFRQDVCSSDGLSFSIDDARAFFEADYSAFRTKAQGNALPSRFSPGDYTPMWEDAEYSVLGSCAAYDVSILPERSLVAIRSEFGMSGARAERLRVYQKLVVMKNTASGVMGSYILSLIPDVGSDDRRIPQRFLSRGADKGGFSGIAVYTSASSGSLHSVQQFKDGVKVRGVNLDSGEGSRLVRCRKAMSILSGIVILSKKSVTTKSGEDMWDDWYDDGWDYGDADDYTYIGDGIYEDENGDLYMDIDGDGVIDAFLLEEPDDDDDEWPEEDDDWPEDEPDDIPDGDTSPEDPDEFWDGSEYGGGSGPGDEISSAYDGLTSEQIVSVKMNNLIISLGNDLGSVKLGLSVVFGTPKGSPFASIDINYQDLWAKQRDYTIVISGDLNDIQQSLVLAHEFMHLKLFQISQDAGSPPELVMVNPELLGIINLYYANREQNGYWLNDAHHYYMGQHVEEMEQLLRDSFPGMPEEFYEYGKWGGGAFSSTAFDSLPFEERLAIVTYLKQIGLLL